MSLRNLIKITKVREESNYERKSLVMFQGGVSVSRRPLVVVVWLTAGPQRFQKARVANFPTSLSFYSYVTMGRESSVRCACRVLHCACF